MQATDRNGSRFVSAAKRRHKRNVRAAFVLDIPLDDYLQLMLDNELPFRLSTKRIIRILTAHGRAEQ
jgi:hypothetical protein